MAFSDSVVAQAWNRAGGKCECCRVTHGHGIPCEKQLVWKNRGKDGERGAWEAHHKISVASGGTDTLPNCEIICVACHKGTGSYGKH